MTIEIVAGTKERWVLHRETGYEVSDQGRVRKPGKEPRKTKRIGRNYVGVNIVNNGKHKTYYIHRLVLEAFEGDQPSEKHEASHLNGDRSDNRLCNLAWEDTKTNANRRREHGTSGAGEKNAMAKLTEQQANFIKTSDIHDADLAARFSVSPTTIRDIRASRTWRYLNG